MAYLALGLKFFMLAVLRHIPLHTTEKEKSLILYDDENKRIVLEGKAMIAFDNYSHFTEALLCHLNVPIS